MERMVVVTTDKDRRGIFYGQLESEDKNGTIVELSRARMIVYFSSDTKGVVGLASIGPQKGSRISPSIPKIKLNGVTSIMDCTKEAVNQMEKELWT